MATHHTDTPEAPEAVLEPTADAIHAPGQALEVLTQADIELLLAPRTISLRQWLTGVLSEDEFPEDDPDEMALGMLASVMAAETSEEALAVFQLDRAREMCGGQPGGRSNVLEILGARPLASTFAEGAACYVIVKARDLAEGRMVQFTTGSRAIQVLLIKHIQMGWLPFKARLEIRAQPTRRGFHPISLVAGI